MAEIARLSEDVNSYEDLAQRTSDALVLLGLSESESDPDALSEVGREAEAMERIRHGHAVLGAYTNKAGATVITSGSTDWAHGLAGRDPQIEQITRNVMTRLG